MPELEIISPGLLTTIQDQGRRGGHFYAIPASGVMDRNAAAIALLLLHQEPDAPLIECTSIAPKIRFHGLARIALTGADFHWTLNDQAVPLNTLLHLNDGDILAGKHAEDQLRGYIGIAGVWKGNSVYGSFSTYLNGRFGGHQGRALKKGDRIEWKQGEEGSGEVPQIPLEKGPEFEFLSKQARETFFDHSYTIMPESNRMGARLQGPRLESLRYQLDNSVPVLPGFIQLPPSGLPIVVLQDGQVTGGYPRIAYIPEHFLSVFNQIPLGKQVKFALR